MAGHHNDGHKWEWAVFRRPDHLGEFQPVNREHVQVNNHNVRHACAHHFHRVSPIAGFFNNADANPAQNRHDNRPHVGIVINDQHVKRV